MNITVFTSNQPRHASLIASLSAVADEVFAIQECSTIAPGSVDDFFRKSPTMQDYFSRVIAAEHAVFGGPRFLPANVRQLPIRMGDVNRLEAGTLAAALRADAFIVFGASFIKGWLCEALVARSAINIHMGMSPWYRGSSTNFWAMYDGRPEMVGATIHRLTAGLDSGPMLFHALPSVACDSAGLDPFIYGMRAVKAAQDSVVDRLRDQTLLSLPPIAQNRAMELRYTRNADFTDEVAAKYLATLPTSFDLQTKLASRNLSPLLRPVVR